MTPKTLNTPVAMLNVIGLVGAAAGIAAQYVSRVDHPAMPAGAIQIVGLAMALPAGIVAAKRGSRRAGVAGRPRGAQ